MKFNKVWGVTEEIHKGGGFEVHRIHVKEGGYCSKHFHSSKYNLFVVESGMMEISTWTDDGIVDKTVLNEGEQTAVRNGVFHRFKALTECVCYEIYYTVLLSDDIIRETVGGVE